MAAETTHTHTHADYDGKDIARKHVKCQTNYRFCLWNGTQAPQEVTYGWRKAKWIQFQNFKTLYNTHTHKHTQKPRHNQAHSPLQANWKKRANRKMHCTNKKKKEMCVDIWFRSRWLYVRGCVRPAQIHGSYVNVRQEWDHVLLNGVYCDESLLQAMISHLVRYVCLDCMCVCVQPEISSSSSRQE